MKKKFKTIITAVVLLAVAFMVTGCGSKGATAGVGETLVAKGANDVIAVKVLSEPEKHTVKGLFGTTDTYGRMQLEVENKGKESVSMVIVNIGLADADKKEVAYSDSFSTEEDNILSKTIAPGAKETGYVYFMDVAGPNPEGGSDNTSYISDKTIADAVFLKVSMLGKTSKKDGKITGNYIDSYLQLK